MVMGLHASPTEAGNALPHEIRHRDHRVELSSTGGRTGRDNADYSVRYDLQMHAGGCV
jgi:hypothetical protein